MNRPLLLACTAVVAVSVSGCLLPPWDECSVWRPGSRPDCSYYFKGMHAQAFFDEPWNRSAAETALTSSGLVPQVESDGSVSAPFDGGRVKALAIDRLGNATFFVEFHEGRAPLSKRGLNARAADLRQDVEPKFEAILARFESSTGWRHDGDIMWRPLFAVA